MCTASRTTTLTVIILITDTMVGDILGSGYRLDLGTMAVIGADIITGDTMAEAIMVVGDFMAVATVDTGDRGVERRPMGRIGPLRLNGSSITVIAL